MMYIDPRAGSEKYIPTMRSFGIHVVDEVCEFGDFWFLGNGPDGPGSLTVAVEHKRLDDLIKCISDRRFTGHQLPGLVSTYDLPILMIEGNWEPGPEGELNYIPFNGSGRYKGMAKYSYGGRDMMYRDLVNHLSTLKYCAGLEIIRTRNERESAHSLACMYWWWNSKQFSEHRSHIGNHLTRPVIPDPKSVPLGSRLLRDIAMQLPGVGDKMSIAVRNHFAQSGGFRDALTAMANADVKEWMKIEGIGKKTAQSLVSLFGGKCR